MRRVAACVLALCACKSKPEREPAPPPITHDAAASIDAAAAWPELADYPRAGAVRTITLPASKPDHPRFDVGGPVLAGGLAIVSSSQLGFVAVDYGRGQIAWRKPAGLHVAPPLVHASSIVLVGDCAFAPAIEPTETLLGCLRVVTTAGSDQAYIAIRGEPREVAAFAAEKGPQQLRSTGERSVWWKRGDLAVTIDVVSGIARPARAEEPAIAITYRGKRWAIRQDDDDRIVATGSAPWQTEHGYTDIAGVVWFDGSPLLRIVNVGASANTPEVHVFDMDATGSLRATFARPVPGIAALAHAVADSGDTAVVVRVDRSLARDVVAAYTPTALLVYVYALPVQKRVDPVGVAVADDAIVVFHDGESLTVLPAVSTAPTPPAATGGVSQNPTP